MFFGGVDFGGLVFFGGGGGLVSWGFGELEGFLCLFWFGVWKV